MKLNIFACQHVGKAGALQQDALAVGPQVFQRRHWHGVFCADSARLAVADGVSGHPFAATAARSLLGMLHEQFLGDHSGPYGNEARSPERRPWNDVLHQWQADRASSAARGAATTLAWLDLTLGSASWLNCGDSRIYRVRPCVGHAEWQLLSRDHTVAQEWADAGALDGVESMGSLMTSTLTSCLTWGEVDPAPQVHTGTASAVMGDLYLVCTDGVHGVLSHEQMNGAVRKKLPLQAIGKTWWVNLMRAGAPDNFSFILCRVDEA